ncbi:MAG: PAS domain S-box protein, partial [Pseudomonadota bacterium]|nr:PAS domain S-box protein [Pseudomonadota bacterium]
TEEDKARNLPARALDTARTSGQFEDEGWRVRKDGTRFWASVVIDAIRDETGELIGFAKVTRDITARRDSEAALRASEERFRLLVQGVTDYSIYMLSPAGEITNWNAGAERIKGYTEDEAVGTHFSRFYTEEDRIAGLPQNALDTARRQGRFENEGWRIRKNGERFWSHVVIDAIYDNDKELIGFAKITRDITERRQSAEALERARDALAQSQKLEAIGKLTGGIAHDFNNLLGVIMSGAELLSRELVSPGGRKVLESMQRSAKRGAELTQQLLTFARQQPLEQGNFNLNVVIGKFEAVLRRAAAEPIRFVVELAPALRLVRTDLAQVEAAILNLVSNARDAMPDGGTLTVRTDNVALAAEPASGREAGAYVLVEVADTGTGMDPQVVARAFEPFFTTKPIGKGTGLGLSQVYGLVQKSGGFVEIVSHAGAGTAIRMLFPALAPASGQEGGSLETNHGNEMALIVDDNEDVLAIAVELFKNMGYDVLTANSAAEAIEIIKRSEHIDVLFSDVVMPGMNGVQLAKVARDIMPQLTILLASGFPSDELLKKNSGLTEFALISKPYRMSDIMKKLRLAA